MKTMMDKKKQQQESLFKLGKILFNPYRFGSKQVSYTHKAWEEMVLEIEKLFDLNGMDVILRDKNK